MGVFKRKSQNIKTGLLSKVLQPNFAQWY